MKLSLKCLAAALAAGVVFLLGMPGAEASDIGDERVIPVNEYQCLLCDVRCYTFAPDSLDPDDNRNNKEFSYQQANWRILGESKSQVPKCGKDPLKEGAHIFDKNGSFTISPSDIARYVREKRMVVLTNGGDLKIKAATWVCAVCNRTGFCFMGDDMDQASPVNFQIKTGIFKLSDGSQIGDCKWEGVERRLNVYHPIGFISYPGLKSSGIQDRLREFWYSR